MVHIPLIVTGPGIPKGKREKAIVSHLDLMPTLKGFLGVQYDDNMKGESYRPLFDGQPIPQKNPYFDRRSHFVSINSESDAMLMDGYKLVVNKKNDRYVFELFNINDDPGELKNISAENLHTRKRIFKKMLEIRKENKLRLKQNLAKISKHVNLELEKKRTLKQLKSLGYVE
jgi:arylsulfatase A-like enzyme